jgi:cytochrome d ubiquinol oxidase subunit I
MLMILLGVLSLILRRGGKMYTSKAFLRFAFLMGPSGLLALLAGWITTEMGRQPWVVYGLLRTKDAVSNHNVLQMSVSLILFIVIYCSVFGVGYGYMMRLIRKGPQAHEGESVDHGGPGQHRTPARPLSAIKESLSDDAKGV